MEKVLSSVAVELNGTFSLDVKTHVAKDNTVEGMLRITGIPRNFRLHDLMLDLEPIFQERMADEFGIGRTWFYLSFHYKAPEGVKSADSRYRGLSVARTNSSRNSVEKRAIPFLGARRIIMKLEGKRRPKPVAVMLWVYWSPIGERPFKGRGGP